MNDNVYEHFKKTLIQDFSLDRDKLVFLNTLNNKYTSIFDVADENDKLYQKILKRFNFLSLVKTEELIANLCKKHGLEFSLNCNHFGLSIKQGDKLIYVELRTTFFDSTKLQRFRNIVLACGKTVYLVLLINEHISSDDLKSFNDIPNLEVANFERFLKIMFGEKEMIDFKKAMKTYKKEMHDAIGYRVTEIFNDSNLALLKKDLTRYLKSFDFRTIKNRTLGEIKKSKHDFSDLYDCNFELIVHEFLENERFKLLFGNKDFAKSYLTSEWLYKQYSETIGLDNTFIVAGFIKSIEQLLWDIAFIKGKGKKIYTQAGEETIDDTYIETTLGNLEYFFTDYNNLDLFESKDKFFSRYLRAQLSLWRERYRNGYFHKHNLENVERVKAIREETIFMYCLILGSVNYNDSLLDSLS